MKTNYGGRAGWNRGRACRTSKRSANSPALLILHLPRTRNRRRQTKGASHQTAFCRNEAEILKRTSSPLIRRAINLSGMITSSDANVWRANGVRVTWPGGSGSESGRRSGAKIPIRSGPVRLLHCDAESSTRQNKTAALTCVFSVCFFFFFFCYSATNARSNTGEHRHSTVLCRAVLLLTAEQMSCSKSVGRLLGDQVEMGRRWFAVNCLIHSMWRPESPMVKLKLCAF